MQEICNRVDEVCGVTHSYSRIDSGPFPKKHFFRPKFGLPCGVFLAGVFCLSPNIRTPVWICCVPFLSRHVFCCMCYVQEFNPEGSVRVISRESPAKVPHDVKCRFSTFSFPFRCCQVVMCRALRCLNKTEAAPVFTPTRLLDFRPTTRPMFRLLNFYSDH